MMRKTFWVLSLVTLTGTLFTYYVLSELFPMVPDASQSPLVNIVYHPDYNIHFFGIESFLHAFDSKKYGKIFALLSERYGLTLKTCHQPEPLNPADLLLVHHEAYLGTLSSSSSAIAGIAEVPPLAFLPNFILQARLLNPMRLATSGTTLACQLALRDGWAVNLSGGYHHAKAEGGEGFCFFADIPLAIKKILGSSTGGVKVDRVLIVDLDAHQGNGFVSLCDDDRVHIFDIFNKDNYPRDIRAQSYLTYCHPIPGGTGDKAYLHLLRQQLPKAISASKPQLVIYNAGTDVFSEDTLGGLSLSEEAIVQRDEEVFRLCRDQSIPVAMVLSGGYSRASAAIVANSLSNLHGKGLINLHPSSMS